MKRKLVDANRRGLGQFSTNFKRFCSHDLVIHKQNMKIGLKNTKTLLCVYWDGSLLGPASSGHSGNYSFQDDVLLSKPELS